MQIKLGSVLEKLKERHIRQEQVGLDDRDIKRCASTLEMKQNEAIDQQEPSERYCNVLAVFGFNSAKHDLN